MNKIIEYKNLTKLIKQLKFEIKQLILVGGCFDLIHQGHLRFLQTAHKLGLVLVALESDQSVKKLKGANRPINPQLTRADNLSKLATVDHVILLPLFTTNTQYDQLVQLVKPDFIAITQGDPFLKQKSAQAAKISAQLIQIPKINTPSTSQLVKILNLG